MALFPETTVSVSASVYNSLINISYLFCLKFCQSDRGKYRKSLTQVEVIFLPECGNTIKVFYSINDKLNPKMH